jgi:hypothetical protein
VTRKLNNATKTKEDVSKSEETISTRLEALRKELASTKRAADKAQEEQRKASRQNLALSEESLDEYRKLSVLHMIYRLISHCDMQKSFCERTRRRRTTTIGGTDA